MIMRRPKTALSPAEHAFVQLSAMERSYEVRGIGSDIYGANGRQAAVTLLNGRKARAKQSLSEMRGSDDMLKWIELIGYTVGIMGPC